MRPPLPRSSKLPWLIASLLVAAAAAAAGLVPSSTAALDLVDAVSSTGKAENAPARWRSASSLSKLVSRPNGARVLLKRYSSRGRVVVYRSPSPVKVTRPGAVYHARALVRGARRGQGLCLRVREISRARVIGAATRCVQTTGNWQRLRSRGYLARRGGSRLSVAVTKRLTRRANRFRVRSIVVETTRSLASTQSRGTAFGTHFHCTQTQYNNAERVAVLDKLKAAGVSWVRIDAGWGGIEDAGKGARNSWYIGMVDFCVEEARKRGLNVLVMLWLTPPWANGGQAERVPPTNPQDYADFARWAAERWRGKVQAWEVWNEPDLQAFWPSSTAHYAALVKAAYPAFKAGDPNALVLLGGPSSNDDGWLRRIYALGGKGSFDVVATHPYQGLADAPPEHPDDGHRWWFTHVRAVRKVMVENGDGGKPIWFTEFGWSAHANWPGIANWQRGVTPEQQADYAVRALRHTQANYPYVPVMFWYKERAHPRGNIPYHEGRALLGADLSERPVYKALRSYLTGP